MKTKIKKMIKDTKEAISEKAQTEVCDIYNELYRKINSASFQHNFDMLINHYTRQDEVHAR